MNGTQSLHRFLLEFWSYDRRAMLWTLGLNLTVGLLEGFGLMLLLPLLQLAGVFSSGEHSAQFNSFFPSASEWLSGWSKQGRVVLVLTFFVGLIVLQSGIALLRERQSLRLRLRFVDSLRQTLFGTLARARWDFLSRHHGSEFVSVLTNDMGSVGVSALSVMQLLTQLATFPVYTAVAFFLSPIVTMLALVTGAGLWWMLRRGREAARQSGLLLGAAHPGLFKQIQEFLGALKLIKIHSEEAGYQHQFGQVLTHLRKHQIGFQAISGHSQVAFRIGGALVLASMTYFSLIVVELPAANLIVLIGVFSRMLPQVSQFHMGLQQLWHMAPAFDNWHRWVKACEAHAEVAEAIGGPRATLQTGMHLKNVSYRHPAGNQTFEVPDLFIPAHQTTAIVGPTGSGKTTLLDLLSGLTPPDSGTIEVDGQPLATRTGWRRQLAYIPQETSILDGTVRENLTWGTSDADEARMMAALGQAAAADFVRALPQGLDTWVGERGVRLSGGEKQRLALARALLRNPGILILDEATSALDREHQQTIIEALKRLHGQMTVLIVTHRLAEISSLVDGIVQVEAGRIGPWVAVSKNQKLLVQPTGTQPGPASAAP